MPKPNIVYIHSHDSGRYVQPYGAPMRTPRLQEFAADAVVFRQAFAASPACSPSRASLLTGRWSHSAGMLGLAHLGFSLPHFDHHLIKTLHKSGYQSVLCGLQHISHDSTEIGYSRVYDSEDWLSDQFRSSEIIASKAVEYLAESHEQPFFMDVGFVDTHRPYGEPSSEFDPRWMSPPSPMPDTPATRADAAGHQSSLSRFDTAVGRVLDALKDHGLDDNTIVIVTTDHGLAWPGMKLNLRDSGIGVMLLVRGPGAWRGGQVIDSLVSQIDLFPTVCELIGVDPPDHVEGVSLVPLLDGQQPEVRDELFAEVNFHIGYEPQRCVRTKRWKYIRRELSRDREMIAHVDASATRRVVQEHGWFERPYEQEMLFDTVLDPLEQVNLVDRAEFADIRDDLRRRLETWQLQTSDPLLLGPVPPPQGARIEDVDTWGAHR